LAADSAERAERLTVALTDSIDLTHAPIPTNDSERLLFRHLFETLVRLDCQGEAHPGLAIAWTADGTGRAWTFTLRQWARFPDGTPITAASIISSWKARPAALGQMGIDSVLALDERTLIVTLQDFRDSVPRLFANPALAITHTGDSIATATTRPVGPTTGNPPGLEFQVAKGDPRDALDRGIDLLVTRDPALVDYAVSRPELTTFPLPWSRTYALLQLEGTEPIRLAGEDSLRRSLARDAVRAEARAAMSPYWWDSLGVCPNSSGSRRERLSSSRIVYPVGDGVAQGLAERIVALTGSGNRLRAAALGRQELAAALRDATERAYILPLPRQTLSRCHERAAWPSGFSIYPLIDTRARVVLRRGSPALTIDWDGTVRVEDDVTNSPGLP
jgi:hypothetical protein